MKENGVFSQRLDRRSLLHEAAKVLTAAVVVPLVGCDVPETKQTDGPEQFIDRTLNDIDDDMQSLKQKIDRSDSPHASSLIEPILFF